MRRIILSMLITLDGYVAGPDDSLDWHQTPDRDTDQYSIKLLENVDTVFLGRKAYDLFAGYWPTAADDPATPPNDVAFAKLFNAIPKVVFSKTLQTADWHNTNIKRDVVPAEIKALKQQPGKDMVVFGGAELAGEFIRLNLVDEYRLLVHPVILGDGKRLWQGKLPEEKLQLIEAETFVSGIVKLMYKSTKGGD